MRIATVIVSRHVSAQGPVVAEPDDGTACVDIGGRIVCGRLAKPEPRRFRPRIIRAVAVSDVVPAVVAS